jgi:hypothetical protein
VKWAVQALQAVQALDGDAGKCNKSGNYSVNADERSSVPLCTVIRLDYKTVTVTTAGIVHK